MKMNKKGGIIGDTFTWVVATLIITFIMLVFISAVFFLSGKSFFSEKPRIETESQQSIYLPVVKNMESFLNAQLEFNNEKITIYDLIEKNKIEYNDASSIFNEKADKIFSSLYPFPLDGWEGAHPWWVRVYKIDEQPKQSSRTFRKTFEAGAQSCEPFNNERSITVVHQIGDKKLVLCIIKAYYNFLETKIPENTKNE